jgi:hypothetical protein
MINKKIGVVKLITTPIVIKENSINVRKGMDYSVASTSSSPSALGV